MRLVDTSAWIEWPLTASKAAIPFGFIQTFGALRE